MRLTGAGQVFRDGLGDLTVRVDAAQRAARAEHGAPEGRLRVTAPPDFGQRFLVSWVAQFVMAHPGITIELDLSNTARKLIEDRFDLAIRGTLALEPNLVTRRIGGCPLVTCARPDYLARRGAPQAPMDLVGHDLLHFSKLRRGRIWSFTRGAELVEVPIAARLELDDGWALRLAVLEGTGICQVPSFVVADELAAGRLVAILTGWSPGVVPLHAVYPDNRLIAQRVRAFVGFIARKARAEPDLQAT